MGVGVVYVQLLGVAIIASGRVKVHVWSSVGCMNERRPLAGLACQVVLFCQHYMCVQTQLRSGLPVLLHMLCTLECKRVSITSSASDSSLPPLSLSLNGIARIKSGVVARIKSGVVARIKSGVVADKSTNFTSFVHFLLKDPKLKLHCPESLGLRHLCIFVYCIISRAEVTKEE